MMISICTASALFAVDNYLFALDENGTVRQVRKDGDRYKFNDDTIAHSNVFIFGNHLINEGFTFGYKVKAEQIGSIAIGSNTKATGKYAIAFGHNAESADENTVAIGRNAKTSLWNSLAIGYNANAKEFNATALGSGTIANNNAVAVGPSAQALGGSSVAIGLDSKTNEADTIAIGTNAQATKNDAIAIGQNSKAEKDHAVAIGLNSNASDMWSQAIGTGAKSKGVHSNAIGFEAKALDENALAFGAEAEAQKKDSIAFGTASKASENSNAIGNNAYASGNNSNAIGYQSFAWGKNSIAIGGSDASSQNSYGEDSIVIGSSSGTFSSYSIAIGSLAIARGGDDAIAMGRKSRAEKEKTIAIGSKAKALGDFATAIGASAEANHSATALGYKAKANSNSNALGYQTKANSHSNALGYQADANNYSQAFGYSAKADKDSSAIGKSSIATGQSSNAMGPYAEATGDYSTAIGQMSKASGENSIAMGRAAGAATNSVSIGYLADANNNADSVALGGNTRTDADGSVALGSYSWANRGELDHIGKYYVYRPAGGQIDKDIDATIKNTKGAVSVGKSGKDGFTRQIINVAAGSKDSDAVNVAQLKAVGKKGFKFETDFGDEAQVFKDRFKNNSIRKSLGSTVSIKGDYVMPNTTINGEPAKIYDLLSGNNLATSVNEDGSIRLLMAKNPELEGIEFGDKAKDPDLIYVTRGDRNNSLGFYYYDENNKENPTILENIAAGTKDTDAVNVSQLIKSSEGNRTKYFSVNSKETGNADNKGATGKDAIAIGPNAEAKRQNSISIGQGAKNTNLLASYSIAIGSNAENMTQNSIAIGTNTITMGEGNATAIGNTANADDNSVAIGTKASATYKNSVVIGNNAKADNWSTVAIGNNVESQAYGVTIGDNAQIVDSPRNANASRNSIAIGANSKVEERYSVAIGSESVIKGAFSTAVGTRSIGEGEVSNAFGYDANASGDFSAAIGSQSKAKGKSSNAFGYDANASGDFSAAIGSHSIAKEQNSLALGVGSQANINNSVALGSLSIADTDAGKDGKYFGVGVNAHKDDAAWKSKLGAVSVGGKVNIRGKEVHLTRQITNVAAGTEDTDAVNVAQLKSLKNYSDNTFANKTELNSKVSDVIGENNIEVESDGTKKIVRLKNDIDLTDNGSINFGSGKTDITKDNVTSKDLVAAGANKVTISGDKGTVEGLTNTSWDVNNIVSGRAATEDQLKDFQENLGSNIGQTLEEYKLTGNSGSGKVYKAKAINIKGDGKNIKTVAEDGNLDIELSKDLDLKGGSITLNNAKLDEDGLTVGDDVKITKDVVQNGDVKLTKDGLDNGGKKITNVAKGEADSDVATVGQIKHAVASAGSVKESDKKDDWAKKRPKATGKNSVSIAGGSTDGGRSNTVSVGAPGHERTISNVAPGVLNSDAATVGQLKAGLNNVHGKLDEYKKDSRAGTASAMAIGNLPQSTIPGKGMVSLGGGFYDGESAMAIGLSKMSDDGKWVVKGSASYDSQENAGAAVSVGFHF